MYLAENLKFLREQRGKTQQELAKLFGVKQKTLSSWECGSRTPAIGMIVEMAKYYEVYQRTCGSIKAGCCYHSSFRLTRQRALSR